MVAGYFLAQNKVALPEGHGEGFPDVVVEQTVAALRAIASRHHCCAILGLDFGGDVMLESKELNGYVKERDRVNLRAVRQCASELRLATLLTCAGPGSGGSSSPTA